jgi:hypothetical protein
MRLATTIGLFILAAGVCAQGPPVTVAEANAAIDRVDSAIRKVLRLPEAKPSADRSTKPVTRAQVLARLDSMFESYKPKFLITPRPYRTEPAVAKAHNKDQATLARIEKLSRWGCIGPVGPLVAGSESLSTEALGDSLGYFMSQIAALTHFAEPKWTPALMPPLDGQG